VTVARRGTSSLLSTGDTAFKTVNVDYQSLESLKRAFVNQHAVIKALNPSSTMYQQNIVQAAVETPTVRQIITPDFSSNTFNTHINELIIFESKRKAQGILQEKYR